MMKRITPLNVVAALAVAGLIATTVIFSVGAEATPKRAAAQTQTFRQALAAKLGARLHKPADEVLAALKTARKGSPAKADRRARRASRLAARAKALRSGKRPHRAQRLARAHQRRAQWATAVAGSLGVSPDDVTAALRALVAERLDSLVTQGWVTADRRTALLACFDATSRCDKGTRPPGLAFLRRGL
jgi:hypothetical protein